MLLKLISAISAAMVMESVCCVDLMQTVLDGNCGQIDRIMKKNPRAVNVISESGRSYLDVAFINGDVRVATLLMWRGGNLHALKTWKNSLLNCCCLGFLSLGDINDIPEDVTCADSLGNTLLHAVVLCKHHEALKVLLSRQRVKQHIMEWKNEERCTPLYIAVRMNDMVAARLLLKAGADADSCASHDETALHEAIKGTNAKMVDLLLTSKCNLEAKTTYGWTPLFMATYHNDLNIVKTLLAAGCNPNTFCANFNGKDSRTALHEAVMNGNQEIAFHLAHANGLIFDARDDKGNTALELADQKGYEVIGAMISKARIEAHAKIVQHALSA